MNFYSKFYSSTFSKKLLKILVLLIVISNSAYADSPLLITGVNRGLGLTLCKEAVARGHKIVISSRHGEEVVKLFKEANIPFEKHLDIDFSKDSSDVIYEKIKSTGPFSGIIHSSSPYTRRGILESDLKDFELYGNFLKNTFALSKAGGESLDKNGRLIYVGAIVGQLGRIKFTPFSVYKLSIRGLVEGLNKEKINSTYINLGSVRSDDESSRTPSAYLSESFVAAKILELFTNGSVSEQIDLFAADDLSHF